MKKLVLCVLLMTGGTGCMKYTTHIPDVLDMRPELSGRHAPLEEVKIEQTRFWAFFVFTYDHRDVGAELTRRLDNAPRTGLRNVTWESELGLGDAVRWLAINGTMTGFSFLRQGLNLAALRASGEDIRGRAIDVGLLTAPSNLLIQSRTVRVTAESVTIDLKEERREPSETRQ